MVARRFAVRHDNSTFDVDYDTDDGLEVFKFQLFSVTSIPPDEQKILCAVANRPVSDDSDLVSMSDKLQVMSINDDQVSDGPGLTSSTGNDSFNINEELIKSDEEFARLLQAEEEALLLQQYVVAEEDGLMGQRLRPYVDQVLMYEDPHYQEAARKTVPIIELDERALVALAKQEGNFKPTKVEQDHAFLLELLFWFKQSFSWVNAPPCDGCGNQTTGQGMGGPLPEEIRWGGSRVELYRCRVCSRITRFPRYNNPMKNVFCGAVVVSFSARRDKASPIWISNSLLETRKGRCGEWANCFTLYCRAFGYESRLILDLTDHVWTECFSDHLGRWMHLDPCEAIFDRPLLYEKGWNKKLNYVIAISKDGVYDVTKRYTRKWHEVLSHRTFTTESKLSSFLADLTRHCQRDFKPDLIAMLKERDRNEQEALERDLHSQNEGAVSLPGRLSGDKLWRISRSEYGSGEDGTLSSSSCHVRLCVDEHVTNIYNALTVVLSQFVDNSLSVDRAIDVLKASSRVLMDLSKSPFRIRRTSFKSSDNLQPSLYQLMPAFDKLLLALHLKRELDTNGEMVVHLAGDPVSTALALPVGIDALDDIVRSLGKCESISKESLCLPLLRQNRIHSGSVLASAEELPFGIATSAFDGTRVSKWEEPNGAKGGWIAYKLKEGQTSELEAYELMSANDAPERDPKDWVLEGSSDGGSSWYIIDEQTSQKFENRFERKLFRIESYSRQSNAFRFKFLAVHDSGSTSRLQIGSIDLYARKY